MQLLKKMRYIFSILLVVCLFFSITPIVHGFITLHHDLGQRQHRILIDMVHEPFWTIHYSFDLCEPVDKETQEKFEQIITKFLQSWLQPLREYTERLIVNDFRYKLDPDWRGATFGVTHICEEKEGPKAFFGPLGIINPSVGLELTWRGTAVMLHEIGHLFGLADTYEGARLGPAGISTGGTNHTRGSQPASFMSGFSFMVARKTFKDIDWDALVPLQGLVPLGQDDENGIIWLYKYTYEGLPMDDCFFPNYELTEIPFGCEPKYPLIFEIKQDNERLALLVLNDDENLDVNAQDANGMTALHHTVLRGFEELIAKLLDHPDIKPFLSDKQGRTALSLAQERGLDKIIALLHSHPLTLSVDAKGKLTTTWGELKNGD